MDSIHYLANVVAVAALCVLGCQKEGGTGVSASADTGASANSDGHAAWGTDAIATTCSESDQFVITNIDVVMDATKMGVAAGSSIADSTAVALADGRVRMFFQYRSPDGQQAGHYSAISSDGVHFTMEAGLRIPLDEWWGPHVKAKVLPSGQLRVYKGATPPSQTNVGIISYISNDWFELTREDGFRITTAAAEMTKLSHLTTVPLADGTSRGYFSNQPEGSDFNRRVRSATSSDLLFWTLESGIRVGAGAAVAGIAAYSAEQPHALQRGNGCVTLFYYAAYAQAGLGSLELRYSTSRDGLTFNTSYSLEMNANGPDIVRLSNGTYLLYYDTGTPSDGFSIKVASLVLK